MITQSFLYNAIFFTCSLVLIKIYGVPATNTAYYFMFFATANPIGPLTLGHLFDTVDRWKMISGTYLTVGEIFPVEVRAKAIAVFFAIPKASGPSVRGSTASSSAMARTIRSSSSGTSSVPT